MSTPAVWYSFQGGKPSETIPAFFNPGDFEWTRKVESHGTDICREITQLVAREKEKLQPYFNKDLVEKGSRWKTFSFSFWGIQFRKNQKKAPVTMSVFKEVPGMVSCSISILEKGSRIKPHRGDTNAIVRCHLPITVPASLPESGFRAGRETREWKPGKLLMFNDSDEHEAWNLSGDDRVILIIDVLRPEFLSRKNEICRNVLSGLLLQAVTGPSLFRPLYKKRKARLFIQALLRTLLIPIYPFFSK